MQTTLFDVPKKIKLTKKLKGEFIKKKLGTDMKWIMKAVITIYNQQTEEEKKKSESLVYNCIGFTSFDAAKLTPIAKSIIKHGDTYLNWGYKQTLKARMPKYWKQIFEMCNQEKLIKIMEEEYGHQ